ncbi:MAG: adenylosuccinate lyase [Candidatus Cloacimonadota bacterium]|nr:adenylosuccinate lyase [Candidatus Cloacimonadota bacterium]
MIERYSRSKMKKIWELKNKYQCWLDVELAACKAMVDLGIVPEKDYNTIKNKADFDVDRILEIEAVTKHDVIAFLTNVAEYVGPSSRWVHYGMTSSDVLDTATALQMRQSGELILEDLQKFVEVLQKRAIETKNIISIGRSHGIHAEPTSFGLKFVLWFDEMNRNIRRLKQAIETISVGQISGAVGNYAHLSPEVEEKACKYLGLKPINIGTQVIQRDRHAEFMMALSSIASTIEKISIEIRHLQRTEVLEVEENFSRGQKGSSAMPHKKNPIVTERMTGLARLIRSNMLTAVENNALWHERDISHSSVERIILPDSTILLNYMFYKMIPLINNLTIYPKNIKRNLEMTNGLVFSQVFLLKLAQKGITREKSYSLVQRNAMKCWETKEYFKDILLRDKEVTDLLSESEIDEVFSYDRYLKNVEHIFKRCGIYK